MARLQEEKKRKKKIAEEVERLETLGQESEKKAVKWVKENTKEEKKKEKEIEATDLTRLYSKKRLFLTYKEELAKILYERLRKNIWPKGYHYVVTTSPKGIAVFIKNPQNKWYSRGISLSYIPEYDLNAAVVLVIQADNTLAVSEKIAKEADGKIAPL